MADLELTEEEQARVDAAAPYVKACPYCGSHYPKPNKDKTEFECKEQDCRAIFSVNDIREPRNLQVDEIKAARARAAAPARAPGGPTPNDLSAAKKA